MHAARAVIRGMHARARHRLVDVHQLFALLEAEQEHRHGADVEAVRAEPHEVIQDARDLIEHHADVLRTLGRHDAEQALDGEHVGVLVAHHRDVIEPVHVADGLVERLRLGELLGAAVQQPDVRVGLLDDFAIELEHQAQHAVRRRMLRAEVHRVVADLGHRGMFGSLRAGWHHLAAGRLLRGAHPSAGCFATPGSPSGWPRSVSPSTRACPTRRSSWRYAPR